MENKTGKPALPAGRYFKYAIGEIILVVIGILIALQINNWNESRKNETLTKTYLQNIKKDLITDTITFQSGIDRITKSLEIQEDLFNRDIVNKLTADSILYAIDVSFHSVRIYKINNSTFLKLTNSGFVESQSFSTIFIDISNYYTKEYDTWSEYLKWDVEDNIDFYSHQILGNWFNQIDFIELEQDPKSNLASTNEDELLFKEFIKSPRFRNYAWSDNFKMSVLLEQMQHQKTVATELIEKINKALKE